MGQQFAFILLIVLCVMTFSQILISANNEKKYYKKMLNDIKLIKEKLDIN